MAQTANQSAPLSGRPISAVGHSLICMERNHEIPRIKAIDVKDLVWYYRNLTTLFKVEFWNAMRLKEEDMAHLRARLRHELQDDLMAWFRIRFWGAALTIAAISFFGVRGVVQQVFETDLQSTRAESREIIVEAATATALAKDAAQKARFAASAAEKEILVLTQELTKVRDALEAQAELLAEVENRASEVDVTFQQFELRIDTARSSVSNLTEGYLSALIVRMETLEKSVVELAEDVGSSSTVNFAERRAEAVTASDEKIKQLRDRSKVDIYLWVEGVSNHRRALLREIFEREGYSIVFESSEDNLRASSLEALAMQNSFDLGSFGPDDVLLSINSNPSDDVSRHIDLIHSALDAEFDQVFISRNSATVSRGIQVALSPF